MPRPRSRCSHGSSGPNGLTSAPSTCTRSKSSRWSRSFATSSLAVADEHAQPGGGGGVLGAGDHVGEERVGDVDDGHAEQAAAPGAQLLRRLERHVAELVGGRAHALDELLADDVRAG